jgi:branched-chain amino acid transport system ATP-binding protein
MNEAGLPPHLDRASRVALGATGEQDVPGYVRAAGARGRARVTSLSRLAYADTSVTYCFVLLAAAAAAETGLTPTAVITALVAGAAGIITGSILGIRVADSGRRLRVAVAVGTNAALLGIVAAQVSAFWLLTVLLLGRGILIGYGQAVQRPLVMDVVPPEARVRAFARWRGAAIFGIATAAGAAALVLSGPEWSWRTPITFIAVLAAILALAVAFVDDPGNGGLELDRLRRVLSDVEAPPEKVHGITESFGVLSRTPAARRSLTGFVGAGFVLISALPVGITVAGQRGWTVGTVLLSVGIGLALAALAAIVFADGLDARRQAGWERLASAIPVLLLIAGIGVAVAGLAPTPFAVPIGLAIAAAAAGLALASLDTVALSSVWPADRPGVSAYSTVSFVTGGLLGLAWVLLIDGPASTGVALGTLGGWVGLTAIGETRLAPAAALSFAEALNWLGLAYERVHGPALDRQRTPQWAAAPAGFTPQGYGWGPTVLPGGVGWAVAGTGAGYPGYPTAGMPAAGYPAAGYPALGYPAGVAGVAGVAAAADAMQGQQMWQSGWQLDPDTAGVAGPAAAAAAAAAGWTAGEGLTGDLNFDSPVAPIGVEDFAEFADAGAAAATPAEVPAPPQSWTPVWEFLPATPAALTAGAAAVNGSALNGSAANGSGVNGNGHYPTAPEAPAPAPTPEASGWTTAAGTTAATAAAVTAAAATTGPAATPAAPTAPAAAAASPPPPPAGGVLLECRDVTFAYGSVQVLFDVNLTVGRGELVALLGPNGVGKTTLLRVLSGLAKPDTGQVILNGEDVTKLPAAKRVALGLSEIVGGEAVFGSMTVAENLRMYGFSIAKDRAAVEAGMEKAYEQFPRLSDRRNQLASTLSGGEKQMLGLSKALMLQPDILIVDEFSLGLAPVIVGELMNLVRRLNADGTSVLLVEQSVNVALSLVHRAYFMEKGRLVYEGLAADLQARPDLVAEITLGGHADALSKAAA